MRNEVAPAGLGALRVGLPAWCAGCGESQGMLSVRAASVLVLCVSAPHTASPRAAPLADLCAWFVTRRICIL